MIVEVAVSGRELTPGSVTRIAGITGKGATNEFIQDVCGSLWKFVDRFVPFLENGRGRSCRGRS